MTSKVVVDVIQSKEKVFLLRRWVEGANQCDQMGGLFLKFCHFYR